MKFGMKLWCLKGIKLTDQDLFCKKIFLGKSPKNIPKTGCFGVPEKFNLLICVFFWLGSMKHES